MNKPVKQPRITSSAKCAVELIPTRRCRRVVTFSGGLFLLLGLAIIFHLQAAVVVKFLLALLWSGDTVLEIRRQLRGHARVRRLRLDPQGRMTTHNAVGKTEETQILKGSIVVRHWACLRLGFDDGLHYVELLSRTDCPPGDWRRLQLVWRQAL